MTTSLVTPATSINSGTTNASLRSTAGAARAIHILREAAAIIWPAQRFVGMLTHIEGDMMIFDALSDEYGATHSGTQRTYPPGLHVPVSETLQASNLGAGRTQAWADCQAVPNLPRRVRKTGIRSQISTNFLVHGTVHIISIASLEPPSLVPFTERDVAYVERIGSYLARQFESER
jgi:hypothetical protein